MPSLKMKTKISTTSLIEKVCLGVCQKSNTISKRSCSHVTFSLQTAEPDSCIQKCQDGHVLSREDMHTGDAKSDRAIDHQELPNEGDCHFQKQSSSLLDSGTAWRIESVNHSSNLETIFSPSVELNEVHSVPNLDEDGGSNNDRDVLVKADGTDGCRQPSDYQTCSVSDFFISDMIIASLPFDGSMVDDDITKTKPFPDYKYAEPNMLFDMVEECMVLPFLENTAKLNKSNDTDSWEEAVMDPDNSSLFLAFNQTRSCNQESDLNAESDQAENFDPHSFIKNLPELSDAVSNFQSSTLPKQSRRGKSVTLALDLDETLVHSTLENCDDADFTFSVFFNMKEHTVYVKQRPHLHAFLERVADMFEVVIFTASQSIYAEQLLDILDPGRRLISRRVYRESCIYSDGTYTKDLTVLGVDLAKVAIIDNCPQVFRLQVNNGIPIKSWFSDPSDCALISLIPFLETLVEADDVRPIIAKSFGNKE